jgi:hypothetical protein
MGREWMRRGRKNSWEGEQQIVAQEKRESEGDKNRDKKIMMVKLIIQKIIPSTGKQIVWSFGKSSGIIP